MDVGWYQVSECQLAVGMGDFLDVVLQPLKHRTLAALVAAETVVNRSSTKQKEPVDFISQYLLHLDNGPLRLVSDSAISLSVLIIRPQGQRPVLP